jgi:hypothetical protein
VRCGSNDFVVQGSADDIVGTTFLKFSDLLAKANSSNNNNNSNNNNAIVNWREPRWVNFYGVPEGTTTKGLTKEVELATKMNNGAIPGTAFRGRVLLSMDEHPVTQAKLGKSKISAVPEPATTNYLLRLDLYECAELQVSKGEISIEISIGNNKKESKTIKVEVLLLVLHVVVIIIVVVVVVVVVVQSDYSWFVVQNGSGVWYQSMDDLTVGFPVDKTQVPDIFINVIKHQTLGSAKRIGFIRLNAVCLFVWLELQPKIIIH